MAEAIMVGMAEIKLTRSPDDILIALGLGSCIAICAYEPHARIAGMAHVVLPESSGIQTSAGKYADTAIPLLLENLVKQGATAYRIRVAIVGGAQLFGFNGNGVRLEVGTRNAQAVKAALEAAKLSIVATDIGGSAGRTVQLTGDGRVRVKAIGRGEHEVVSLGQPNLAPVGLALSSRTPGAGSSISSNDTARRAQSPG